jgi:hypothetical protein
METFTYTYHDQECIGNFLPSERGKGWVKVIFFDHSATILPTGIKTRENKTIWVQAIQAGEAVWPHELIQTLGEALSQRPV